MKKPKPVVMPGDTEAFVDRMTKQDKQREKLDKLPPHLRSWLRVLKKLRRKP